MGGRGLRDSSAPCAFTLCGLLLSGCLPALPAETFGEIPNGSAWAITTRPFPELDETHLVVGRVVQASLVHNIVRTHSSYFPCALGCPKVPLTSIHWTTV